eukprot:901433-Rhodomonas_salina.4
MPATRPNLCPSSREQTPAALHPTPDNEAPTTPRLVRHLSVGHRTAKTGQLSAAPTLHRKLLAR